MIFEPIPTDNIALLPVKHKAQDTERFLKPVDPRACKHYVGPFVIDQKAGKCICEECKQEVSPMFVLERLMQQEGQWMQSRERYQDEMKRLSERSRTTCDHCGKMTRVSKS